MGWRLAKSLQQLLLQINARKPNRSKSSDGTIGDAAHSARTSDHNPDGLGTVCALDITNDPKNGFMSEDIAEGLRAGKDRRIKYIISNRKICSPDQQNWAWRKYSGSNPHDHHVHISVNQQFKDDDRPWDLSQVEEPSGIKVENFVPPPPLLKIGSRGNSVMELQHLLEVKPEDGIFGPKTKAAVQKFQSAHDLVDDGIVGPATWAQLKGEKK